ncbi:hypothetical protein OESDEN_16020 [Oesophagostomum dentatum]|uniref:Uncharacterized protein n=1 Tax=Oesophagostomum dentatum TaxID=61180 RepID=A0A0B1SG25_OESDE|nr:hypothetical protein OESDEN_16020 [Oesophagostomum dentatum]
MFCDFLLSIFNWYPNMLSGVLRLFPIHRSSHHHLLLPVVGNSLRCLPMSSSWCVIVPSCT